MARGNKDMWMLVVMVLAILFLASIVYIGVSKYKASIEKDKEDIFKQGAQYGYESAVAQLIESAADCNPVEVHAGNYSIEFIDKSCGGIRI